MRTNQSFVKRFLTVTFCCLIFALAVTAQSAHPAQHNPQATPDASQENVPALQDQLLQLLRLSPTLAEVVSHDPSLLSDSEYVNRTNPELARFLQTHPQIAQNPDFYLFNNLHGEHEQPAETLERKFWPGMTERAGFDMSRELFSDGIPFLVFVCILAAFLWLTHVLLENRRWGKIFKLQTDVHGKLIERFGTSQEVLTYMNTDAGKRFLEATPIAVGIEKQQPVPSPVARVLTPLQIGIVMTMLGIGLRLVRGAVPDGEAALLVLSTVMLMPGLGFIISAGITWVLARRLGLMPADSANH